MLTPIVKLPHMPTLAVDILTIHLCIAMNRSVSCQSIQASLVSFDTKTP
jgi:hypothetical protein